MAHLIIDDTPRIWNHCIVLSGKGVVASARRSKGVTDHLGLTLIVLQQLLANIIGSKSC